MNFDGSLSVGLDAGNSSVKIAVCDGKNKIVYSDYKIHKSDIYGTFEKMMEKIPSEIKKNIKFGSSSGVFGNLLCKTVLNSTECLVKGVQTLFPEAQSIAEIGSQNSQFISGIQTKNIQFSSNKNCSAGTGSFFEDQMTRLGTKIEDYSDFVKKATFVPRLAGRCAVFAKTDIIHLQQDGEKTENILKGLTYSVVNNFKGTIVHGLPVLKPVFFAGGTSKNLGVIEAFKSVFHLSDSEFIYGEESCFVQAAGTAILARENETAFEICEKPVFHNHKNFSGGNGNSSGLNPLKDDYLEKNLHQTVPYKAGEDLFLGVDVGSTSTNFVLINQKKQVVDFLYFRTLGDSAAAVQHGFDLLSQKYGENLKIINSGVTGSGRIAIGKKFKIPVVHDEITAQSTGTLFLNPDCDTIFEIGGQDAKFISCKNGVTKDFAMNKVCSAGTGSFIEDQAERLGLSAAELGMKAFESSSPAVLDQRCTVFMKTSVESRLAQGIPLEDICAGLCYSVVKNYIHKVVANKTIGQKICFQGGLAYNHGIVAAFKSYFGKRFCLTPYFSVTGALGMALLAKEEFEKSCETKFDPEIAKLNRELFGRLKKSVFGKYKENFDADKKTIGIPRSLMIYKFSPMAWTYFNELGFNVKLSDESCEETIRMSQQLVKEETCFPIKLMHAHMQELVEAGCDYIFMPSIYTMAHKHSNLKNNYGCVYMQSAARLVADVLGFEKKGIKLLNPVLQMNMGAPHLALSMIKIGIQLGKNPLQCKKAMMKAGKALKMAQKMQEEDGAAFLQKVSKNDKVLVLITRTYGVSDPVLNMNLPELLIERGCKVITHENLKGHDVDISEKYKNLYWPFSQHILGSAKIIHDTPNLYAVYLTNHGCGPDTMISHLFSEIMGKKPYLQIEVDEHYSKVGLITRIEAFLSNLEKNENKIYEDEVKKSPVNENLSEIKKNIPLFIPNYNFLSGFIAENFRKNGFMAEVLPKSSKESLSLGKDFTTSKEYVTFASLTGQVLLFEKNHPKTDENDKKQLLLFQTEGSETDGFYASVIRSELDALGRDDIEIFAPKLENLVFEDDLFYQIYSNSLLQTDEKFEELYGKFYEKTDGKKLLVLGEPLAILDDSANGNFISYLENHNHKFKINSLSEYFEFLWKDKILSEIRNQKNYSKEEKLKIKTAEKRLLAFEKKLRKENLVEKTEKIKKIQKIADSKFKFFSGANLRYRYAEKMIPHKKFDAIIEISPTYENATTILNLAQISENVKKQTPCFQIQFDGFENTEFLEQLEAFLNLQAQT